MKNYKNRLTRLKPKHEEKKLGHSNLSKLEWGLLISTAIRFFAIGLIIIFILIFSLFDISERPVTYSDIYFPYIVWTIVLFILPLVMGYRISKKVQSNNIIQAGISGLFYAIGLAVILWLTDFNLIQPYLSPLPVIVESTLLSLFGAFIQVKLKPENLKK